MTENGNGKTPTWQWIAGIAMSGLMFFSSLLLLTSLSDIKSVKQDNVDIAKKVAVIERGNELQFEAIKEWREEIRLSLERIANNQVYNAERQKNKSDIIIKGQESAAKIKEWNKIK